MYKKELIQLHKFDKLVFCTQIKQNGAGKQKDRFFLVLESALFNDMKELIEGWKSHMTLYHTFFFSCLHSKQ